MEEELNIFTLKILSVSELISRNFTFSFGCNSRSDKFYCRGRKFYSIPCFNLYRRSTYKFQCYLFSSTLSGFLASIGGYRFELIEERKILPLMILTSIIGGIAGAVIMLNTPPNTVMELVPYPVLVANLLFIFGAKLTAACTNRKNVNETNRFKQIAGTIFLQLFIALYGGFFGAGMGIMMLAALALMGMDNIHKMNAFKVVLGSCINGIAALIFIYAGVILWLQTSIMIFGAVVGGFWGAHYARKYDPAKVRKIVIFIGSSMTLYFFAKVYLIHN